MISSLVLLCVSAVSGAPVETRWAQVAPEYRQAESVERSPDCERAAVLIQGLRPHFFSSRNVAKAEWDTWQRPGSDFVNTLGAHADIFAFAYGQNVAVDEISATDCLRDNIRQLKQLGYTEVVLVGHSAGGVVARQFVEDQPDAGVTKVIQVCTPNGGSCWGGASLLVRQPQEAFLDSLTARCCQERSTQRTEKKIPNSVEFVCLIGHVEVDASVTGSLDLGSGRLVRFTAAANAQGDGVVSSECQWTADLQEQGIPVIALAATHSTLIRSQAGAEIIALLIREKQPRWTAKQVAEAKKALFKTAP